ncbi:DUF2860 domain-containing protein [Psychromonas sp. RZ22]|uniref:DUF2860 domain-containing protein n=1 Tax=Psychromonas algarum TaxID=2555643 RepID=UPI001067BFB6|nr:DUF2860 domain-containing protein [Psychromonas sp. RZ22]TEW53986.1 DUF2860 domain-containing protein [Psychromonas sp. RZ22]
MLKGLICLISGVFVSYASLARPLSEEAGWQFTLNLNVGLTGGQSQLKTNSENEVTNDLDNSGQYRTSVMGYPLGRIQYTLDSLETQFYLGNSRDQVATAQLQYELGVIQQLNDGSQLTFAVFPRLSLLNETWADPFLVGSKREETKEYTAGGRIAVEQIFGSPFTLKYAVASSSVKEELSGQNELNNPDDIAALQRDSLYQRVEVETMFPVARGLFLKPTVQYTHRNADGNANSYEQYTGQLSFLLFRDRHLLVTTINAGIRNYQQINPIFNEKQDLVRAGIFSIYSYKRPFDWQHWSWTMMAGYNQEKSDISFYDNYGFIVSTGLTYKY